MQKNDINVYKDTKIIYIINKILFKTVGSKCRLLYISGPGSSPSKVYMFKNDDNKMYAVKICDTNISRVSLSKEVSNIELLVPFLKQHLPNIIYIGRYKNLEIMISECFGFDSFFTSYSLSKKPFKFYLDIWNKVLLSIMKMWKESIDYNYNSELNPRNNSCRIKRIKTGILKLDFKGYNIDSLKNLKIVVNGLECLSLEEIFDDINKITDPLFGVTCHGDPQPSNIIISENDNNWYLVDWEWSGNNHDYRLMFSHLYGWWGTRTLNTKDFSTFEIKNGKIVINYEIMENNDVTAFQKLALKLLKKNFDLSSTDKDDINRFLALLYLGDARFLNIWGRIDFLPVLIGEAAKTIFYIKNKNLSINKNFTIGDDDVDE